MKIICRLKDVMDVKNIRSLSEVQRNTKLARRTLDKLYHNKSNQVNYETMTKLCEFLNCDLNDLFQMVGDEEYKHYIDDINKRNESVRKGYVYFIKSNKTHLIKIGKTNDIERRLKDLSNLHQEKLELIRVIESDDSYELERKLHKRFSSKRVNGEWFNCKISDLLYLDKDKNAS